MNKNIVLCIILLLSVIENSYPIELNEKLSDPNINRYVVSTIKSFNNNELIRIWDFNSDFPFRHIDYSPEDLGITISEPEGESGRYIQVGIYRDILSISDTLISSVKKVKNSIYRFRIEENMEITSLPSILLPEDGKSSYLNFFNSGIFTIKFGFPPPDFASKLQYINLISPITGNPIETKEISDILNGDTFLKPMLENVAYCFSVFINGTNGDLTKAYQATSIIFEKYKDRWKRVSIRGNIGPFITIETFSENDSYLSEAVDIFDVSKMTFISTSNLTSEFPFIASVGSSNKSNLFLNFKSKQFYIQNINSDDTINLIDITNYDSPVFQSNKNSTYSPDMNRYENITFIGNTLYIVNDYGYIRRFTFDTDNKLNIIKDSQLYKLYLNNLEIVKALKLLEITQIPSNEIDSLNSGSKIIEVNSLLVGKSNFDGVSIRTAPVSSSREIGRLYKNDNINIIAIRVEPVIINGVQFIWVYIKNEYGTKGWVLSNSIDFNINQIS